MPHYIGRSLGPGEQGLLIGFVGFHTSFSTVWNHITLALKDDFPIIVADITKGEIPDYLFFSCYGQSHTAPRFDRCIKIYTNEENIRTPWHECDYSMTSDRISEPNPRHLRLPIYAGYLKHCQDHTGKNIIKPFDSSVGPRMVLERKSKFCNFIYSNASAKERILFFEMLSKYKKVDSGGAVMNNIGGKVADKLPFLEDYKFTIAFENSRYPGYVSEKIVEPMISYSIPIYWGCRDIGEDFNPFSFVCANEPEGSGEAELVHHFEQVIRKIAWLDTHDEDYLAMMAEPWLHGNAPNRYCQPVYIQEFLSRVFSTPLSSLPRRPPAPMPPRPRGWSWADHPTEARRSRNVKK